MTESQMTLLSAVVGAIVGAIIGGVFTYIGAVKIANRQRLIDAGRKFREAFNVELVAIESHRKDDVAFLLERAFNKHLSAVVEFREILSEGKRIAFDQAWEEYHCTDKHHNLTQYTTITPSPQENDENRKSAIKKIHELFSFTKEKCCF